MAFMQKRSVNSIKISEISDIKIEFYFEWFYITDQAFYNNVNDIISIITNKNVKILTKFYIFISDIFENKVFIKNINYYLINKFENKNKFKVVRITWIWKQCRKKKLYANHTND